MQLKSRLKRISKMLNVDLSKFHLIALEVLGHPEKSTYTIWDGTPGSGAKRVNKEEWEAMAHKASDVQIARIKRGSIVKIIDDIEMDK